MIEKPGLFSPPEAGKTTRNLSRTGWGRKGLTTVIGRPGLFSPPEAGKTTKNFFEPAGGVKG